MSKKYFVGTCDVCMLYKPLKEIQVKVFDEFSPEFVQVCAKCLEESKKEGSYVQDVIPSKRE